MDESERDRPDVAYEMDHEAAFIIHYDTVIRKEAYGNAGFTLALIDFPTDEYGQVNPMNAA